MEREGRFTVAIFVGRMSLWAGGSRMACEKMHITWADFGPFLGRLRRRRGLSQERVAALLGCHRITVWRIERGETRPSILFLRSVERITGLAEHEARWVA